MEDSDICECGHIRDEHSANRGHCTVILEDPNEVCGCIMFTFDPDAN